MSDNISHIDTEAIELDLMERYLEGSLSADEQREMESTLAEDPILADALEGLALIEDKEEMKLALGRIQEGSRRQINKYVKKRDQLSKRRSRVGHSNFKRTNYYVAAAAAVAVLICTVWVIDMSSPKSSVSDTLANEFSEYQPLPELKESEIVLAPSALDSSEENEHVLFGENVEIAKERSDNKSNIEDRRRQVATKSNTNGPVLDEIVIANENSLIASGDNISDNDEEMISEKEVIEPLGQALSKPSPVASAPTSLPKMENKDKLAETSPEEAPFAIELDSKISTATVGSASKLRAEQTDTTVDLLTATELEKIPLEEEAADDFYVLSDEENRSKKVQSREAKTKSKREVYKPIDLPAQSEEDIAYGKIAKGQHMADLMVEAVALYDAGSNDESLVLLKEVLQTSPENPAANFYAGSIYRKYSQMKTATSYLKEATKFPQSPLIENARWELAQVYLARNKNGLAKKLLIKIATEGTKFAEQAREELEKMK